MQVLSLYGNDIANAGGSGGQGNLQNLLNVLKGSADPN